MRDFLAYLAVIFILSAIFAPESTGEVVGKIVLQFQGGMNRGVSSEEAKP